MKLWMSALVVVLISSQSFAANAANHADGEKAPVVAAEATKAGKPVVEAKPFHERYTNAVNACLLQQGSFAGVEGATRAIGEDLAARR
jgi:hypothetical protein